MMTITRNGQIGGHEWAMPGALPVSGALPVLYPLSAFDLSASRRAGGYTSAL